MENTYNYLKTAWLELSQESKQNPCFAAVLFMICCIPLPNQFNSISIGLLGAVSIWYYIKRREFRFDVSLIPPILLYILMAFSWFWSIDTQLTSKALSKELMLIAVPVSFMLFPVFSKFQKQILLKYFSYAMVGYAIFYLIKAGFRYAIWHDSAVFFYHELVTMEVNAIHVSVYFSLALCWFLSDKGINNIRVFCAVILSTLIVLLSSKIILTVTVLLAIWLLFSVRRMWKLKSALVFGAVVLICGFLLSGKISQRFSEEFLTITTENSVNTQASSQGHIYNKSIREAWSNPQFTANDYFPGTALRVYQFRIFTEMLAQDDIFWTGYGLNASYVKTAEKAKEYKLNVGYGEFNFHNQYVQNFADLGIFGLILLLAMLVLSFKNGIRNKDFVHISFTVLMISLFLTESFLWRQRGVTFFIAMYCLFNSGSALKLPQKKNTSL